MMIFMCGIIGFYKKGEREPDYKSMLSTLRHRGPDNQVIKRYGRMVLAHTRLSIIDPRTISNQPMSDSDNRYVIVFNGEIYNYKQLRKKLEKKSYKFKSFSDTEVLLYLYKEYGKKMLKMLEGMFAFAIYDKKSETIFLARDRIGEKPLYYAQTNDGFLFASELSSIIRSGIIKKEINPIAVGYYFLKNFYHIPEPVTLVKEVYKLKQGHYMFVKKGKISEIERYWIPKFIDIQDKRYIKSKLKNILKHAVVSNLVADVKISILLSGGIDSSIIAKEVSDMGYKLKCYTIGEKNGDKDINISRKLAESLGYKHEIVYASNINFLENLESMIKIYGEPINNWSIVYVNVIANKIRNDGIKVTLSGAGGDELFYGYPYNNQLAFISKLNKLSRSLHIFQKIMQIFINLYSLIKKNSLFSEMFKEPQWKIKGAIYRKLAKELSDIIGIKYKNEIKDHDYGAIFDEYSLLLGEKKEYIDYAYWCALMIENQHSITLASDMGGMLSSVEIRSPFLYHPLVELAFSIPYNHKIGKTGAKDILKDLYINTNISEIMTINKRGFGYKIDIKEKVYSIWKNKIMETLENSKLVKDEVIKKEYVDSLLIQLNENKRTAFKNIMAMYTLEIWYKAFMCD